MRPGTEYQAVSVLEENFEEYETGFYFFPTAELVRKYYGQPGTYEAFVRCRFRNVRVKGTQSNGWGSKAPAYVADYQTILEVLPE
jgi:hypothetical protein